YEDRTFGRAAAGDDEPVSGENRRRRGDLRAMSEPPQFLPVSRVVTSSVIRSVGHQFRARRCLRHGRRAPRWYLVALCLPHLLPRAGVQRQQERIVLRIALQYDQIV